jgi:predicted DNA-binding transcriptional regulator YafY
MPTAKAVRRDRQIVRVLALLNEGGHPTIRQLAARFHTRRETIYRTATVVLRFRADQAPYVRERIWHHTQQFRDLPDGRLEMRFRAGGTFEIARWILGWGDAVEVMRPSSLRRDVAAILTRAAASYA